MVSCTTSRGIATSGGGLSWSVVDEFTLDTQYGSFSTGLAIRPSDDPSFPSEVWVRGTVGTKSGSLVALRRSTQGGAQDSWRTVTTYAGDTRWSRGIGSDGGLAVGAQGEVYDVGQVAVSVSRKTVENRWTTWRLAPGASSVQVVDQLPVSSYALKAAVDAEGRVYVHGGRNDSEGSVPRASVNGNSGTWGDHDLVPGASFYAMTLDDEGSLYLAGDYGFLLTATDGQVSGGGGIDRFRIKIWDRASDSVVYDNLMGQSDDLKTANPQVLGGGSIVIHQAK
jgi:hypothetical protein